MFWDNPFLSGPVVSLPVMQIKLFFVLISCLLALVACGKKGPVRPLDAPLPGPVKALELRQLGDSLVLGWQLPDKNQDGTPLRQPPQLDLYRMVFDPANDCPECTDRSILVASCDPDLPAPARRIGDHYLYTETNLLPGQGYRFKLVPRSPEGIGQTTILSWVFQQPPPAPELLSAIPRDRAALLTWQPLLPAAGETLLGYRLYRRFDDSESFMLPVNSAPVPTSRFEDFGLDNGTRYFYRIRAMVQRGKQTFEGLASTEVEVTPKAGI